MGESSVFRRSLRESKSSLGAGIWAGVRPSSGAAASAAHGAVDHSITLQLPTPLQPGRLHPALYFARSVSVAAWPRCVLLRQTFAQESKTFRDSLTKGHEQQRANNVYRIGVECKVAGRFQSGNRLCLLRPAGEDRREENSYVGRSLPVVVTVSLPCFTPLAVMSSSAILRITPALPRTSNTSRQL